MIAAFDALAAQYEEQVKDLRDDLNAADAEIKQLKDRIDELEMDNGLYREKQAEDETTMQELETELDKMQAELDARPDQNDVDDLHAIIRALRRTVEDNKGVWSIKQYCAPDYDKALTELFEAAHAL